MAKRKGDLSGSYVSEAIRKELNTSSGVQSTDRSLANDEKNTLTGLLNGKYEEVYQNLNKLSGARTEITYFKQVPIDEDNGLVNLSGFNTADPNLGRFVCIKNLSVKMDNIDSNFDDTENNGPKSVDAESKFVILPNTILPLPNDRFLMKFLDRTRLYKVTSVNPLSGDSASAYECSFILEDNDFNFDGSELKRQIVENYVFDETYIGTDLRSVFRVSEYETLNNLKDLYLQIGKIYKRDFWDDKLETFMLKYENNVGSSNTYDGSGPKYIVVGDSSNTNNSANSKPKFEFKNAYKGKELFDGALVDFILKNRIFDSIEYFPVVPTQYATNVDTSRIYRNTIFYSIEKRNRHFLKNIYQMPIELNISNPDSQPVLYGKISLIHVGSSSDSTLSLFPKDMYDIIQNQVTEDIPVTEIDRDSVYDMIVYSIALYINNRTKYLSQILNVIDSKIDDVDSYIDSIPSYQMFYLLPILGYVIKEVADTIVSATAKDDILMSDPISTRRVDGR